MTDLRPYIDHTLLRPSATPYEIEKLCQEAIDHDFKAVCVNSSMVGLASEILNHSRVTLVATVGFPLGAASTASKVKEASIAASDGATEIDMVLQIGWLKAGMDQRVVDDIRAVKMVMGDHVLKVIIETAYLDKEEMAAACKLIAQAGGDFVKTSTGFASKGATLEDVAWLKECSNGRLLIKASGGIQTGKQALAFIAAGADRIGTSNGINLLNTT